MEIKRNKAISGRQESEPQGRAAGGGGSEGDMGAMEGGRDDCWALKRRARADEEFHF